MIVTRKLVKWYINATVPCREWWPPWHCPVCFQHRQLSPLYSHLVAEQSCLPNLEPETFVMSCVYKSLYKQNQDCHFCINISLLSLQLKYQLWTLITMGGTRVEPDRIIPTAPGSRTVYSGQRLSNTIPHLPHKFLTFIYSTNFCPNHSVLC